MPLHPFSILLAVVVVACHALFLLWPHPKAHEWGWQATLLLPVFLLVLWISVQRAVPTFDDRSYHRTRPITDGAAYRKMVMLLGLVFGGIALAVLLYAWSQNIGWEVASWGIAALTLPAVAWSCACGLASSLSTRRQVLTLWSWLAVMGAPALSFALMALIRDVPRVGIGPELTGNFYLSSIRTIVLAAVVIYPLIWWLAAAGRKWKTAMGLSVWIGALLPWLWVHGQFFPVPESEHDWSAPEENRAGHVKIDRPAPVTTHDGGAFRANEVLNLTGLRTGEVANIHWIRIGSDDTVHRRSLFARMGVGNDRFEPMFRGEGSEGFGGFSVLWDSLAARFPEVSGIPTWSAEDVRISEPYLGNLRLDGESEHRPTLEECNREVWVVQGEVFSYEEVGEVDLSIGGRLRVPDGGVLMFGEMTETQGGKELPLHYRLESWQQLDGPWFGKRDNKLYFPLPLLIIEDPRSGERRRVVPTIGGSLARTHQFLVDPFLYSVRLTGSPAEQLVQEALLRNGNARVFWPLTKGTLSHEVPPPSAGDGIDH